MSSFKNLQAKLSKNEAGKANSRSWAEFMQATEIPMPDMEKAATELGFSSFDQMKVGTDAGKLYKGDEKNILDIFANRTIIKSQVSLDVIKQSFQKLAGELSGENNESASNNLALNALEKFNRPNDITKSKNEGLTFGRSWDWTVSDIEAFIETFRNKNITLDQLYKKLKAHDDPSNNVYDFIVDSKL